MSARAHAGEGVWCRGGAERTNDKCPAESSSTHWQFETLIEKRRTALHRLQNGRVSLGQARWQVTLYVMWARVESAQLSSAQHCGEGGWSGKK